MEYKLIQFFLILIYCNFIIKNIIHLLCLILANNNQFKLYRSNSENIINKSNFQSDLFNCSDDLSKTKNLNKIYRQTKRKFRHVRKRSNEFENSKLKFEFLPVIDFSMDQTGIKSDPMRTPIKRANPIEYLSESEICQNPPKRLQTNLTRQSNMIDQSDLKFHQYGINLRTRKLKKRLNSKERFKLGNFLLPNMWNLDNYTTCQSPTSLIKTVYSKIEKTKHETEIIQNNFKYFLNQMQTEVKDLSKKLNHPSSNFTSDNNSNSLTKEKLANYENYFDLDNSMIKDKHLWLLAQLMTSASNRLRSSKLAEICHFSKEFLVEKFGTNFDQNDERLTCYLILLYWFEYNSNPSSGLKPNLNYLLNLLSCAGYSRMVNHFNFRLSAKC